MSEDQAATDYVLENTTSGGVGVNVTVVHLGVLSMPFGGVGASGYGGYHGESGFNEFTHQRSVYDKATWIDAPIYPPASATDLKIMKLAFFGLGLSDEVKMGLKAGALLMGAALIMSKL